MSPRHLWSAACAAWLAAAPAGATSYVMMADEDLADQAPLVAVVRVDAFEPARGAAAPATDYLVRVERAVKGVAGDPLRIRVPGGTDARGMKLRLFGMPRFTLGERALVFLAPAEDGSYRVVQALLGAFHDRESPGTDRRLAVRDLTEASEVALPGRRPAGDASARDFDSFVAWLSDRASGRLRGSDYFVRGLSPPAVPFTQLGNGRWFEFDSGGNVPWRALQGGQEAMPGGGFAEFQDALAAWNAEPATPINLTYAGTTAASGIPCNGGNTIRWNDPQNEIPGSFSCATGGVLAVGGYCFSGTGVFNGMVFDRIVEGDVVIQDGAGCFLSGNGNEDGEEVFGHELGHSLGLGHSCGDGPSGNCVPGSPQDEALMRAFAHGDGRGAALGCDDENGARFLYQAGGSVPPAVSIGDVTVTESNATVNGVFTVSLSSATCQTVTVAFATADGTALAGSDYTAVSGTLTFPPSVTSQPVTVPVAGDLLDEPTETFFVNLSSPTNATIADGQAVGTILDDDPPPALSISDCAVAEGNTGQAACVFTLSLSPASGFPVSVAFATADGTAVGGQDFVPASGTLIFPAGATSQTVDVDVIGDLTDEPDETFTLNLSSPVNATIADGQGVGTIADNDPPPTVSVSDCAVVEGNTGQVPCDFTVSLSAPSSFTTSVSYATADGTATAPIDYTPAAGTLTFAPGTSTQPVTVPVLGDVAIEPDETFFVNLTAPVNATLGDAQGVGTIGDDDAPSLSSNELNHGAAQWADLAVRPDLYRIGQKPFASYEVVIDGTSGDIVPVTLQRLAGDNVSVLQAAAPVAVGDSVSLRWANTTSLTVVNQHIRVDGTCATPCGPDDVYRIRALETTYSIPRFNNSGSQVTVLLLQNPATDPIAGHVWFWSAAGSLLGTQVFSLPERQTLVLNTATVAGVAGQGGAITVSHDGRYGDLTGKTVALEPSTGFSFDSPMTPRPR